MQSSVRFLMVHFIALTTSVEPGVSVRQLLSKLNLEGYTGAFEAAGYDDADFLMQLSAVLPARHDRWPASASSSGFLRAHLSPLPRPRRRGSRQADESGREAARPLLGLT